MDEINRIVGAIGRGLKVQIDGEESVLSWSIVTTIHAGRAKTTRDGDLWILVLGVGVELLGQERVFIVGEVEPAWLTMTELLPQVLPGIPSFETWGPQAVTTITPLKLYDKDDHN